MMILYLVTCAAYVVVENEQSNERYGYEYQTKLTVNFHRKRLTADQNLFVRVGDFVQYGSEFYEIVKTLVTLDLTKLRAIEKEVKILGKIKGKIKSKLKRKKPRTAKQKAAWKKVLAANKRRR